jgi:SNF2 family DNA or RNA helicase
MAEFKKTVLANQLTLRHQLGSDERLNDTIRSANIDLNPHQVEAAIFAFKSPISRGAILADEVGLGKTIEAGLIINQLWAEGRRKILVLAPASLRTQWQDELLKHFELESLVVDGPTFKKLIKSRHKSNPINQDGIYIASHNFGYHYEVACAEVAWDLVVIDEAHRLRNVYRKGNKVAKKIREAISNRPKILLTATPLQNNLMEMFGLVSFLDERYMGTDYSFKNLYLKPSKDIEKQFNTMQELKRRLMGEIVDGRQQGGVLTRTLRSQVQSQGLVHFTNRYCITEDFNPNDDEIALYNLVSEYLRRPVLASTLSTQRNMMELVYRKILASSSFAIAGTLYRVANYIAKRLQQEFGLELSDLVRIVEEESLNFKNEWHRAATEITLEKYESQANDNEIFPGYDDVEMDIVETQVEAEENDDLGEDEFDEEVAKSSEEMPEMTKDEVLEELRDVLNYYFLAQSITKNQKSQSLIGALKKVFKHADKMSWPKKAVIFTESRRTQDHLEKLLSANGYNIVLFNGTNASKESKVVFEAWSKQFPKEAERGNRSINVRKSLVWHFKNLDSGVLITTEAGAEGLNLQFANIVINYDLPWNPQRIEQRIGRCHRYGQSLDVLVVNFINRKNFADERVYELLKEKIRLFGNLFDFSDKIIGTEIKNKDDGYHIREIALGGIGSGADFEKRVLDMYRNCRTEKEIEQSFKKIQTELFDIIEQKVEDTQKAVIQNFDEDVQRKLKLRQDILAQTLSKYDRKLAEFVKLEFGKEVIFTDNRNFKLKGKNFRLGTLSRNDWEVNGIQRASTKHPLIMKALLAERNNQIYSNVVLNHRDQAKRKVLEEFVGKGGQLIIERVTAKRQTVNKQDEEFDELIFSAIIYTNESWQPINANLIEHIDDLEVTSEYVDTTRQRDELQDIVEKNRKQYEQERIEQNEQYIDKERDQIRRFSKESLMRHETDMQKIRDDIDKLENQLSGSKTMGFHERQEIQDSIDKQRKDYFKAQERYIKAEREQFNVQDELVRQLKSRMQLTFNYTQIASIKFKITG